MSKASPLGIKRRKISLGPFFVFFILITIAAGIGLFSYIDKGLYDLCLQLKIKLYPVPLNPRIIRVDLNDTSEKELEETINSRAAFSDLIEVLGECGSRAAFDFIFKGAGPHDRYLADAASGMETLVLSIVPVPEEYANFAYENLPPAETEILSKNVWHIKEHGRGTIPIARTFIMSNPEIAEAASQLGHIGIETDADGIFRKTPLFYRWNGGVIPSLSLAMAVAELGINPGEIEFFPGKAVSLPVPGDRAINIPVDESGYMVIPYTAAWADDSYRISFSKVVAAKNDSSIFDKLFSELNGSITMVADITTSKRDFGITPFETVYPLSGIHTAVISGILNNYFYVPLHNGIKFLFLLFFGTAATAISFIKKDLFYHLYFLLLFFIFSGLVYILWYRLHIMPWYGTAASGILFFWVINFISRLFSRYKEQLLLKNALTRYFPRSLAERITAEGRTDLIPAYKELTILFSDISGFTKWSSDKDPEQVHAFLTDYLESMAQILFSHGGTVDKFMGDGILAFFGDPFEQNDHAERALKAAVAMQKKVTELRGIWLPKADINLKVRIGINTGQVIVGNLGTKTRIEYTVIGSAVNLAQRMESNAPVGGILMANNTWRLTNRNFQFGEKRLVTVKGYNEPVEAYELVF
jgi:adenylate cyclase